MIPLPPPTDDPSFIGPKHPFLEAHKQAVREMPLNEEIFAYMDDPEGYKHKNEVNRAIIEARLLLEDERLTDDDRKKIEEAIKELERTDD